MAFPRKVIKDLELIPKKTLYSRREQLLEYINKDGTYLPKSVLHADLDRGMLDFVKNDLYMTTSGKVVPLVDIILTTQNWSQFVETWQFVDYDFNPIPPFITVVRNPEVKYGTNPALQYTIPNRKPFYYASVPTWNGNQQGMDVYQIPQPVPVDVTYNVRIVCNRMRELNQFNKIILQKFSSRQAYTFIKGQYVPIIMNNITDESIMDLDKRKYYVQNYDFTMLGYLIDEEEFKIKPAISRVVTMMEVQSTSPRRRRVNPNLNPDTFTQNIVFSSGSTIVEEIQNYKVDMTLDSYNNVSTWDIFINGDFYGTDVNNILINTNDNLRIEITKEDVTSESNMLFTNKLV